MKQPSRTHITALALIATLVVGVAAAQAGKRQTVKFTNQVSITLATKGGSDSVSGTVSANKSKCSAGRDVALVLDPSSKGDPNLYQRVGSAITDANGAYLFAIPNINAADSYFAQIDEKRIFRTKRKIGKCLAASSSLVHK